MADWQDVLENQRQWAVVCSDSLEMLKMLPDGCINVCLTSPPYFALRSYIKDGHENKAKELGLEKTPADYVARMVEVFREVRRVLHDSGIFVLNIGDSYAGSRGNYAPGGIKGVQRSRTENGKRWERPAYDDDTLRLPATANVEGCKSKDLIGIPWQLALALRADGWYLRNHCHWVKLSPMPSSAQDRLTVAHEDIFLFAKSPRYHWDSFAVRRPSASATLARDNYTRITTGKDGEYAVSHDHETPSNPAGRQWRTSDVWLDGLDLTIAQTEDWLRHLKEIRNGQGLLTDMGGEPLDLRIGTEPLHAGHYAAFPSALVRPFLRAGASERGCCARCGEPWRRIVEKDAGDTETAERPKKTAGMASRTSTLSLSGNGSKEWADRGTKVLAAGWQPGCSCDTQETVPPLVLDPFAGSGTTGIVARQLGLRFLGVDLSPEYAELARSRIATALRMDELKTTRSDGPGLFDALEATP